MKTNMFLKSPAKMFLAPSMFSVRATSRIGLTNEFTTIEVPCTPTLHSRWTNSMITIMPPRLPAMSLTKATNRSLLAQKSVSQLTSTTTPTPFSVRA